MQITDFLMPMMTKIGFQGEEGEGDYTVYECPGLASVKTTIIENFKQFKQSLKTNHFHKVEITIITKYFHKQPTVILSSSNQAISKHFHMPAYTHLPWSKDR